MTLKYESELLFDLMKRDGDDAPSDVLPYESELKEKYLNQVVGAYPKLQDYRPEWLNYNLYHHLPSEFPIESIANVTSAIFNNVVPYAYKSAILKGNTLVNSWKKHNTYLPHNFTFHDDGFMELKNPILFFDHIQTDISLLKPNTKYLLIIEAKNNTLPVETYFHQDPRTVFSGVEKTVLFAPKENGVRKAILTSNSDFSTTTNDMRWGVYITFGQLNMPENERGTISVRQMLIEYQEGMENWDIPYFVGMQSVKMPVLTTSNEDGTKTNILTVNEDVTLRGIGDVKDELDCLTGEVTERVGEIVLDGSENWEEYVASGTTLKRFVCEDKILNVKSYNEISNILPNNGDSWAKDITNLAIDKLKKIVIQFNSSDSRYNYSLDEFKQWLSQNPITVQYELSTESIKTVDLTVTDQDGNTESVIRPLEGTMHVNTSSQTLPPLLDMSVPVEATTQNLMSFANIEEEEK